MKYSSHPGRDAIYVICDICGCKFRRSETVKISDKWNLQNNMIVCHRDADERNEQNVPFTIREQIAPAVRPESPDRYQSPETDDRIPSAPQFLVAQASDTVELLWSGPIDNGSSRIEYYVIERADPQLIGVFVEIGAANSTYYSDLTASLTGDYSYRVAAVNGAGQGPYSEEAQFPVLTSAEDPSLTYLATGSDLLYTSQGNPIIGV